MNVHDFYENQKVLDPETVRFLDNLYRATWPTLTKIERLEYNKTEREAYMQKHEIDVILTCIGGRQKLVEEKIRRKDWGDDVLIEYLQSEGLNDPGWIYKLRDDVVLSYHIKPTRRTELLPGKWLKKAWLRHEDEWKSEYGVRHNPGANGTTWNCPVPTSVLWRAINDEQMR
jgi:hypothetical protein